ncbi:hypothetical protein, partial [Mesorhizobium sp. M7A.F.Ca.CA.001.06.1.1]|uniref:hypothetical protein n=1 Tax=Mesorhizobium sp. M7A.F.Ca.CA.001.06.1.1 TaxID=2496682 RepID=UPI001FE08B81
MLSQDPKKVDCGWQTGVGSASNLGGNFGRLRRLPAPGEGKSKAQASLRAAGCRRLLIPAMRRIQVPHRFGASAK